MNKNPFKYHRFPPQIILLAVRWYRRYPRTMLWHVDETYIRVSGKWRNNRIESDHAALMRITDPGKGFQSLRTAKCTLSGVEALRTIKRGHLFEKPANAAAEVRLMESLFGIAA